MFVWFFCGCRSDSYAPPPPVASQMLAASVRKESHARFCYVTRRSHAFRSPMHRMPHAAFSLALQNRRMAGYCEQHVASLESETSGARSHRGVHFGGAIPTLIYRRQSEKGHQALPELALQHARRGHRSALPRKLCNILLLDLFPEPAAVRNIWKNELALVKGERVGSVAAAER